MGAVGTALHYCTATPRSRVAVTDVAGIFEGALMGELDKPFARSATQLCRKAGADLEAIPAWGGGRLPGVVSGQLARFKVLRDAARDHRRSRHPAA